MAPTKVILLSCGSYNPPTNMHLRMFEIARDHIHKMGSHVVIGGVISPVHDLYGKKDLAGSNHRCAMLRLALQNNDWIKLSDWETTREGWTRTRMILQHHQNLLNSWLFDTNDIKNRTEIEDMNWIPDNLKINDNQERGTIQVKLLCGADVLESFGTPGLWADEDIDAIVGQHGLVVVTREGSNPNQFIYDSDILTKYMHNIIIVTEWITNEISSTKIRRALRRGDSVKYLLQDSVLDYIYKHKIYGARRSSEIDITMESPSPVEIISIDIPDSIMKKNLVNSTGFSNTSMITATPKLDDNDLVREKFIGAMSENGNKLLQGMKNAYPGQAKQIIATETGESHILDEVGSISDRNSKSLVIESANDNSPNPINKDNLPVSEVPNDLILENDKDNVLKVICNFNDNDCDQTTEASSNFNGKTLDDATEETQILVEPDLNVDKDDLTGINTVDKKTTGVDEACETLANETQSEEQMEKYTVNKAALEIDGKYLKSLVNSRKSPKKCKNKDDKLICNEESIRDEIDIEKTDAIDKKKLESVSKVKEDGFTQCEKIDSVNSESQTDLNFDGSYEKIFPRKKNKLSRILDQSQLFGVQGSLDSVKFNIPRDRSVILDSASKKSKSYESIKYDSSKSISFKSFEISYSDTLKPKSDSASQLMTANFCTECCCENEVFATEVSANQETFYTIQSDRSSPLGEDSTECDICSACDLDSTEVLDPKSLSTTDKCDLCEICNDINADFEGDLVMPYAETESDNKQRYILDSNYDSDFTLIQETEADCFEIENCGLEKEGNVTVEEGDKIIEENFVSETKTLDDNDHFEIENCGLDNKVRNVLATDSSKLSLQLFQKSQLNFDKKNSFLNNEFDPTGESEVCADTYHVNKNLIYASNENVKYPTKFSLPKYVPNIPLKGGKKIIRKGSFIMNDSSSKLYPDNRRYSSVDNLQQSKSILKLSDRVLQKSKGNKLIASADNIQSKIVKTAKLKKFQKSANDIDSLTENLDTPKGNFTLSENDLIADDKDSTNIRAKIKIRDSDMVKMILTKHGIKIISEKETAL